MTVHICPVKDIECGSHKVGWCAGCPKHGTKDADTIEALTAENARLREHLGELLATLHGDGGHYEAEHGTDKAVTDAIARYYAKLTEADAEQYRLREELERARVDAERWRMFLATRPPNTHAVIKDAIDAARKPG